MYTHRQKSPSSKQVFARKRLATTQSNEKIKYRKKREVIIRKAHRRRRDKGRITRWILRDQYFTVARPISYAKRSFCLRSKRVARRFEARSIEGGRERGHVARFDGGCDAWRNNGGGNWFRAREHALFHPPFLVIGTISRVQCARALLRGLNKFQRCKYWHAPVLSFLVGRVLVTTLVRCWRGRRKRKNPRVS